MGDAVAASVGGPADELHEGVERGGGIIKLISKA